MAKGKSARGEIVDFDLLKIKEQIASAPKTTNVRAREDFIDAKFKRRIRKIDENIAVTASQMAGAIDTTPSSGNGIVEEIDEPEEFMDATEVEAPIEVPVEPPVTAVRPKKLRVNPTNK
jgi:hypothetical protein